MQNNSFKAPKKIVVTVFFCIVVISCNDTPYMQGKRLYAAHCQNCHMEDGTGLARLIPQLSSSKLLGTASIACVLKNGIRDTISKGDTYLIREMPSFGNLSTTEITNITNYINHKWAASVFKEISILSISSALDSCRLEIE